MEIEAKLAKYAIRNSSALDIITFNPRKLQEELLKTLDALRETKLNEVPKLIEGCNLLKTIQFKDLTSWSADYHFNITSNNGKPSTALQAFADKLKRMATDYRDGGNGDLSSIKPFIESVVSGRIKVWDEDGKRCKFRERRKCYTEKQGESQIYYKNDGFGRDGEGAHHYKNSITVGHFRENWQGWILTEQEIQVIKKFFNINGN